jgi:hypothetical protein
VAEGAAARKTASRTERGGRKFLDDDACTTYHPIALCSPVGLVAAKAAVSAAKTLGSTDASGVV